MLKLNYDRIAKFLENKYIFINIRNNLISYYFCKQTPVIFDLNTFPRANVCLIHKSLLFIIFCVVFFILLFYFFNWTRLLPCFKHPKYMFIVKWTWFQNLRWFLALKPMELSIWPSKVFDTQWKLSTGNVWFVFFFKKITLMS